MSSNPSDFGTSSPRWPTRRSASTGCARGSSLMDIAETWLRYRFAQTAYYSALLQARNSTGRHAISGEAALDAPEASASRFRTDSNSSALHSAATGSADIARVAPVACAESALPASPSRQQWRTPGRLGSRVRRREGLFSANLPHGVDLCRLQFPALFFEPLEGGLEFRRGYSAAED